MRSVSKKRAAKMRAEKPVRDKYLREHPFCEAANAGAPGRCLGEIHIHEVKTRARGGSTDDPSNLRSCCNGHNEAISQDPETMAWAYEHGFLRHGWDA